jgi:hypothetical protein
MMMEQPLDELQDQVIGEFEKNSAEMVKVRTTEWKGQRYVDIRCWYNQGQKPTWQDLTINIELLPQLLEILQRIEVE